MAINRLMQMAASAAAGEALYVEDVFSTYLYDGTGSSLTITNDIDLDGEGGLTWFKARNDSTFHILMDTERGGTKWLRSDSSNAESTVSPAWITYNSDGFTLPVSVNGLNNTQQMVSWTFRKAPKFFDVVTYTGTGSATTVSHNLGSVPGCIMVKRTDTTGDWQVYHRANTANPETDYLVLNSTAATADSNTRWNDTAPTDSVFTVGTEATVNASGGTYVAYLWAHNDGDGEFGETGDQDIIKCGSYTGNSSTYPEINLGFEPQYFLVKSASSAENWVVFDVMRGMTIGNALPYDVKIHPNTSGAESGFPYYDLTATGLKLNSGSGLVNTTGNTYIYIAIRRGPMKTPESGTEVFAPVATTASTDTKITTGFPVDWQIVKDSRTGSNGPYATTRLTGVSTVATDQNGGYLRTNLTSAEATSALTRGWDNIGYKLAGPFGGNNSIYWNFRRAPGFFDVVAYEGTGSATTISHNLGVVPELIIVKNRDQADAWQVYAGDETDYLVLNTNAATADNVDRWNDTAPTDSVFTIGTAVEVNTSTEDYIAYLFASVPGVSKVGSYTGDGNASQTIDCGFSTGARFVVLKRTDSTGDWLVFDSERGINTGNEPTLRLNTIDAEQSVTAVDPDSSGFKVVSSLNTSGHDYIFLAIA